MTKTRLLTTPLLLLLGVIYWLPANADFIDDAVNNQHRTPVNTDRDKYRNPAATLRFFGLQPQHHVLEILPGRGWYTEILAPATREHGKLTVASFGEHYPNKFLREMHHEYVALLAASPKLYDHIRIVSFHSDDYASEVADGTIDMVLTFRNTHNWLRDGLAEKVYLEMARVLRPGGILGVVQHRTTDPRQKVTTGYVTEQQVINLAKQAGLILMARSDINSNTRDGREHPEGVWTLPPSLRLADKDREKYLAVGESDRMTLQFVKPQ